MGHETRYLTVAKIAEALQVSKMTVYRMIRSGDLPAAQFGRSLRISESAFKEYLERSQVKQVDASISAEGLSPTSSGRAS